MIKGFEKLSSASDIFCKTFPDTRVKAAKSAVNNKDSSQQERLTASLAGLDVLGRAGTSKLKYSKVSFSGNIETVLFKNLFERVKYIPSQIWIKTGGKDKCVKNPVIPEILKSLENLPAQQKKVFVDEYCKFSGFPNLCEVTAKIDSDILNNVNKMCKNGDNTALFAGYNINSSVGRNMAFPGSDCDGLFVVVEKPLSEKVNFGILGESINQRLVSTTGEHYPEVYPVSDILKAIEKSETVFRKSVTEEKLELYKSNLLYDGNNHIKAAQFNIDIANGIENIYDKDMVCRAAFFAELLRAGKVLLNNIDKNTADFIKNSALYKYSNLFRQEGLKNKLKPKLINRQKLCHDFWNKNDEEKFEVCKDIFASSLGEKSIKNSAGFEEFDMGNTIELYQKISSFFG